MIGAEGPDERVLGQPGQCGFDHHDAQGEEDDAGQRIAAVKIENR